MITHTCSSSICKSCGQIKRRGYSKMRCDQCKKDLGLDSGEERRYLETRIFYNNNKETESLHFCSWRCCIKFIPKIKSDYFVDLPYLHYDETKKGLSVKDFLEAINIKERHKISRKVKDNVCTSTHGDLTNV